MLSLFTSFCFTALPFLSFTIGIFSLKKPTTLKKDLSTPKTVDCLRKVLNSGFIFKKLLNTLVNPSPISSSLTAAKSAGK